MKGKKTILIVLALSLVAATAAFGSVSLAAQNGTNYPPIVQKLADRFKLNVGDVQKVFDEERATMQKDRQAHFELSLDQAVKNGSITETQKEAILKKQAELEAARAKLQDLTAEKRLEAMEKMRTDIETWAEKNDIDPRFWGGFGRHGFGGRGHGPVGFGGPGGGGPGFGGPETTL